MAQEEFLQLDSIVIKQGELTITKIPNRSWEYEGHDTINVNQSNQQIILVRYCGITMSNNSSTFGGNVSITSYNKLYDLKISTQLFNLLNAMNHETAAPRSLDGGSATIIMRMPYNGKKNQGGKNLVGQNINNLSLKSKVMAPLCARSVD